ncbi:MAG: CoA pyrophosphatase [Flavobacteriales bacterium]|nr:MAG: CoA pyrophosphatase [Flavobacteriales bacterium]
MRASAANLDQLEEQLTGPLPGHAGFLALSGWRTQAIEEARKRDASPKESAVMVLLHDRDGRLQTTLIQRPEYDGVHSGQVAFPGGRREPEDVDLWATAQREMHEEIGVPSDGLRLLGRLSELYIPPSRSLVSPHVAYLPSAPSYAPDAREVAAVFEVALSDLLAPAALGTAQRYVQVVEVKADVACFHLGGREVWGATAMMLWELRELLLRMRDT